MNQTVPSVKLICRSLIQRNKSLIVLITCIILFFTMFIICTHCIHMGNQVFVMLKYSAY